MKRIINYFKLKHIENYDYKKIYIAIVIVALALVSLFISKPIEIFLRLNYNFNNISNSKAQVHFVDVGQGDCIAIRFSNNKTALIDCGPKSSEKKMVKYLNNIFFHNESKHFDYIILTHTDSDHMGNIDVVLSHYSFSEIYLPRNIVNSSEYLPVYEKLTSKASEKLKFNHSDYEIDFDNESYLKWLSPSSDYYDNDNDYSAVMLANIDGFKFLFTGDASKEVENIVLFNYDLENVDVLKAGHHGSNTSTSLDLLLEAKPKNIVFSVGENSYGHPSNEVIQRIYEYQSITGNNIKLYETQNNGNVIFKIEDDLSLTFIDNINNYFFVDWWVVVLVFVIIYCCWFIIMRKYAINRVFQNSKQHKKNKKI